MMTKVLTIDHIERMQKRVADAEATLNVQKDIEQDRKKRHKTVLNH
jgi:hypothetical protein